MYDLGSYGGILCIYTPTLECYIQTCVYVDVCPLVGDVLVGYGYQWCAAHKHTHTGARACVLACVYVWARVCMRGRGGQG